MTTETIQAVSLISTVLASIFMYFEKKNKRYDDFSEEYISKVLNPYITEWKHNKELNTVKFISKRLKKSNKTNEFYIPKYIYYLVEEENDKEKLHKVLITDYLQHYPNNENKKWKLVNSISECLESIVEFLFCLTFSLLLLTASVCFASLLLEIFTRRPVNEIVENIVTIIITFILNMMIIIIVKAIKKSETDYYSLEEEKIKRYINEKVNYYDKNFMKFFI